MSAADWHRAALALLVAFLGAQAAPPHGHTAASSETALVGADAGDHATPGADHAEDCLLCRTSARTRAVTLPPAVAADPVSTPRIAVVEAAIHAKRGPDLCAGPAPRAPPPLPPLV